jgi:molybdopterin-containing oxidoreductase family membrane subunit
MSCNVISPQLFWFKKIRRNLVITFILSIVVNIGMWFERFVIIVTSLHRDFLTSSWTMFHPTYVDIGVFLGTIGIFFVLFLLYARSFPVLALNEIKTILRATGEHGVKGSHDHHHEVAAPAVEEQVEEVAPEAPAEETASEDESSDDDSSEEGDDNEKKENE